ncbi:hypothetical protein Ppa06_30190 [Planomonospora parontospora subsp. parontospora]|uniref:Uncharacterized protein n=2 Tax=Planomonospora parontospora TaxID=58119 RepID=A0AA37F516_9ACTN|nr:hypothetical protein [Planomonospora parontospora]GGK71988.1 hypothetical protein GCM10010126_34280 [Planomonospora parontospora]GII09221.1 hypothetical protein Ppa06_30190 [Planomonospora parontospora subsp. parontospora]
MSAPTDPTAPAPSSGTAAPEQHLAGDVPAPEAGPAAREAPLTRGRYRSGGPGHLLELRVDVDGVRPQHRVSGDFFTTAGETVSYTGSFVVDSPAVDVSGGQVVITGTGAFTFTAAASQVRVSIPLRPAPEPPGEATVRFSTPGGRPGAAYLCPFVSPYFRSVLLEQDSVAGTVPFTSYDTASLPGPAAVPPRELTVVRAYAEAGIELQLSAAADVIAADAAGTDLVWDDAELHNAMVRHFSLHADAPQWRVWMLLASAHVGGYRGIMFDYGDACQRQGAAVFHDAVKGSTPQALRAQLRTYVHELGHAFNLLHSWQKNLADPPRPLGPNHGFGDLSWMNYVQHYRPLSGAGGEAAYWAAFPFQFTDDELVHLRHGHHRDVVMGANPFGRGAAEISPELFDEPVEDRSGLALELRAKDAFEFGEPVVVELKLRTTDLRGRTTHGHLHPATDFTHVAITRPSGRTVLYRPVMRHCVDDTADTAEVRLDADDPAIYRSAYIGHGADGHYFAEPGEYRVRAQYLAADGSRIVSPVLSVRVRHPVARADQEVAELMLGEQAGALLSLLGSDSPALAAGNDALCEVITRYGGHPLAVYARMVRGVNAERGFKDLAADARRLTVRPPDAEESIRQLSAVAEASAGDGGVDNITLNMVMRRLASAQAKQGDLERASGTLDRMVRTFEAKRLRPAVLERIRRQAEAAREDLAAEAGLREREPDGPVSGPVSGPRPTG